MHLRLPAFFAPHAACTVVSRGCSNSFLIDIWWSMFAVEVWSRFIPCFFLGQVKWKTKDRKTSWPQRTWMAKSDSLHISIIPTISAGWNKTYSSQCCLPVQPFLYPYCGDVYRPLLEPVESLLQMLLLWDPAARGGTVDADTNKPYCNTALQNILNLKVNMLFKKISTGEFIAVNMGLQNKSEIWHYYYYTIITYNVTN